MNKKHEQVIRKINARDMNKQVTKEMKMLHKSMQKYWNS